MSTPTSAALLQSATQQQFLSVISRDEAERRYQAAVQPRPLGIELVPLLAARGRVLGSDIVAQLDVPGFDRSNVDGFAVRSEDTAGVMEETPVRLRANTEVLLPGQVPGIPLLSGTATPISTGGMLPRGADAVVMIEHTEAANAADHTLVTVRRAAAPGEWITFAGSDIARGETVLWRGQVLTSREIGVLAALGLAEITVQRRPRVGIISTGDEVVLPGEPLPLGSIYDSNAAILAGAVAEVGGEPLVLGVVQDDEEQLEQIVTSALALDLVLLSGGTSKGAGDLSYRIVSRWNDPGIVVHGVALKPGKPICLAATRGKPVIVLPGFPTSAIFTFHEFVAPIIRQLAGLPPHQPSTVTVRLPVRLHSDKGRTEYTLVRLFGEEDVPSAYPLGKGSGAVTTFSQADGFVTIPAQHEMLEAEELVEVTLLDRTLQVPDLVVIGSHCAGLDFLLGELRHRGFSVTSLHVGSQGGVQAARRGECDLAGIHLLDPATGHYNAAFVPAGVRLISGYQREQCFVCRQDDSRFATVTAANAIHTAVHYSDCVMVNRNPGSGTRLLLDSYLAAAVPGVKPPGYGVQVKSHNAVAAAVQQGRADWGCAIRCVAESYGLKAIPLQPEHYDFLIPESRLQRPAVQAFLELLQSTEIQTRLAALGCQRLQKQV